MFELLLPKKVKQGAEYTKKNSWNKSKNIGPLNLALFYTLRCHSDICKKK